MIMVAEEVDQIQVVRTMSVLNEKDPLLTTEHLVILVLVSQLVLVVLQSMLLLDILEISINLETLQQFVTCQLEEIIRLVSMIQVVDLRLVLERMIQYDKEKRLLQILQIYLKLQIIMEDSV